MTHLINLKKNLLHIGKERILKKMYISAAFENQQQKTFKSGAMLNKTFLFELFVM